MTAAILFPGLGRLGSGKGGGGVSPGLAGRLRPKVGDTAGTVLRLRPWPNPEAPEWAVGSPQIEAPDPAAAKGMGMTAILTTPWDRHGGPIPLPHPRGVPV